MRETLSVMLVTALNTIATFSDEGLFNTLQTHLLLSPLPALPPRRRCLFAWGLRHLLPDFPVSVLTLV